jgi:hypothetical protein
MPPDWVHMKGAVAVGNAPPVEDQPTARPWSSVPTASLVDMPGRTPISWAV